MSSSGLFDECVSAESPYSFQGQYCSVFFKEEHKFRLLSEAELVEERDGDLNTFTLPRVGFCIPSSCSPSDFRSSIAQLAGRNRIGGNRTTSLTVITDENYCYTQNKINSSVLVQQFDWIDIAVLYILKLKLNK